MLVLISIFLILSLQCRTSTPSDFLPSLSQVHDYSDKLSTVLITYEKKEKFFNIFKYYRNLSDLKRRQLDLQQYIPPLT